MFALFRADYMKLRYVVAFGIEARSRQASVVGVCVKCTWVGVPLLGNVFVLNYVRVFAAIYLCMCVCMNTFTHIYDSSMGSTSERGLSVASTLPLPKSRVRFRTF